MAKTLTLDINCKLFSKVFFIPDKFKDTIDSYHISLHSVALTLVEDREFGGEQNLFSLFCVVFVFD